MENNGNENNESIFLGDLNENANNLEKDEFINNNFNNNQNNLNNKQDLSMVNLNTSINLNEIDQITNEINYSSDNNEELLKIFIGNNYEKIVNNKFNIAAFMFTNFYIFYRKMFLFGLIFWAILFIISNYINFSIIYLIISILCGFFINKLYLFYAKRKINKIKLKNNSSNYEEIKSLCEIKGRTSVGMIFVGFVTEIVLGIITVIIMIILGINSAFGNFIKDIPKLFNGIIEIFESPNEYNGYLFKDESIGAVKVTFTFKVPDDFVGDISTAKWNYEKSSYENGVFNIETICDISFSQILDYDDVNELANLMAEYYSTEIKDLKINNVNWLWLKDDSKNITYYLTSANDRVYLFEYSENKESTKCQNAKNQFLNSIKIK